LEVAELQEDPGVARILLEDLLILNRGPVVPLLLDVLLGGDEYPRAECSSSVSVLLGN
jgi:hypothetical protein